MRQGILIAIIIVCLVLFLLGLHLPLFIGIIALAIFGIYKLITYVTNEQKEKEREK